MHAYLFCTIGMNERFLLGPILEHIAPIKSLKLVNIATSFTRAVVSGLPKTGCLGSRNLIKCTPECVCFQTESDKLLDISVSASRDNNSLYRALQVYIYLGFVASIILGIGHRCRAVLIKLSPLQ